MNNEGGVDSDGRLPTSFTTSTTTHSPTVITTTSTTADLRSVTTTSGPQSRTVHHPTVTTTYHAQSPILSRPSSVTAQPDRHSSIRSIGIRRQADDQSSRRHVSTADDEHGTKNRRRSCSEPQRLSELVLAPHDDLEIRLQTSTEPLHTLHEEGSSSTVPQLRSLPPVTDSQNQRRPGLAKRSSTLSLRLGAQGQGPSGELQEYDADVVDILDVIDPEVSTLTTLNNVQNSLFVPNLGWLYNRRPTYDLSQSSNTSDEELSVDQGEQQEEQRAEGLANESGRQRPRVRRLTTTGTISSVLTGVSESHNYAVLPHGASLQGWTREEKEMLNNHVQHLLTSRRAKFKRGMRGFGRYVRKPVGFLVTLYAFLLTFWGAAWVLFLIGWISVGGRQAYFIEICDQILTALFCVVGIGMAPWRAIDTYHMIYVAKYAHKTWRLRKERGLPDLRDRNELPTRAETHAWETGGESKGNDEEPVLKAAEQERLEHHQNKLAEAHTFYKPHETTTHNAFSIRLLIAIVVLLDFHSMFQMALGGTTWGIYYKRRPKVLTAVILSCSLSCNITAGILISIGDRKSRKTLIVEQMFRQGVTQEALEHLRKRRGLVATGLERKPSKPKKNRKKPTTP